MDRLKSFHHSKKEGLIKKKKKSSDSDEGPKMVRQKMLGLLRKEVYEHGVEGELGRCSLEGGKFVNPYGASDVWVVTGGGGGGYPK